MASDNNTIVPKYQVLVDDIRNQIAEGKLKESEKLMTETELCETYNVSRITVRKAITLLSEEGLLVKKQGIGTFVTPKKISRVYTNRPMSFTEMCEAEGRKASSELLSMEWEKPETKIGSLLNIPEGDKVLHIVRARKCDDIPVLIEEMYLAPRFSYVSDGNLSGSILAEMEAHGTKVVHATSKIEICYANEREQEHLNVPVNQPLLLQYGVGQDANGDNVYYSKQVINSERYNLTIVI